jgi:ribosomal-protein-serine acetyltransferase
VTCALTLRRPREEDAPRVAQAIAESYEHLRPWSPWARPDGDPAGQVAWIREMAASPTDRVFTAWLDGRPIGACGLHARIAPAGREIGYWVHVAHTRRGIATEMARRMVALAFGDPAVDHVEIHHHPDNVASAGVPAKLGFTRQPEPDDRGHVVWRLLRS